MKSKLYKKVLLRNFFQSQARVEGKVYLTKLLAKTKELHLVCQDIRNSENDEDIFSICLKNSTGKILEIGMSGWNALAKNEAKIRESFKTGEQLEIVVDDEDDEESGTRITLMESGRRGMLLRFEDQSRTIICVDKFGYDRMASCSRAIAKFYKVFHVKNKWKRNVHRQKENLDRVFRREDF